MSLRTADYDYVLPEELIARHPTPEREGSRMLVVDRATGTIAHRMFREITTLVPPDALLVLNDTKVIPARVYSDDGRVELLLLEQLGAARWMCYVKPGRRMRLGAEILVGGVRGCVLEVWEAGERVVEFDVPLDLDRVGHMPLPPYMRRGDAEEDRERYQTVYARHAGAIAAPTAGLHFTPEILAQLRHEFVTLHVGAGTFKPVMVENITEHPMHRERFDVSEGAAGLISDAERVLAVGTTVVRVLESLADERGRITAGSGSTQIFIHPPYEFRRVNHMLTNFHLPKSTLLMLVSAFAGSELIREAYAEAIRERYRFYSYGDCMLML